MNKKGAMQAFIVGAIIVLAVGFSWMAFFSDKGFDIGGGSDIVLVDGSECSVASVSSTYNDVDVYTPGTDPGLTNLRILTDNIGIQAEGAMTLSPVTTFEALLNSSTVFNEVVNFETSCVNSQLPIDVKKSGAPTITMVNSNGVTLNADASAEAVDADAEYDFEMTVKSPSKACASRYGALLVADYDKTYVSNIEAISGTLSGDSTPDYLSHIDISNGTSDGFTAFVYEGELCNAEKVEFTFRQTLTSTTASEDNANIVFHWIPLNYDVNEDTLKIIGPVAEDEDNNQIAIGNTSTEWFTD